MKERPAWQSRTATIATARRPSMSGRKPLLAEIGRPSVLVGGGDAGEPVEGTAQELGPDALGVVPTLDYPQVHALELHSVPPVHRHRHNSVVAALQDQERLPGASPQGREP